ncbi:hypothetical protein EC844_12583 [Acinetobacter calcoaceticus]|uniref:Uncharacterized protein n=1 Tax=Acinetobacter calcoaceticus TaxID=471 RepID=A0A4R1XKW1_ACICA|nr:hypothetical protein EC844_12583 [Acinetobacter calcoaceticus]
MRTVISLILLFCTIKLYAKKIDYTPPETIDVSTFDDFFYVSNDLAYGKLVEWENGNKMRSMLKPSFDLGKLKATELRFKFVDREYSRYVVDISWLNCSNLKRRAIAGHYDVDGYLVRILSYSHKLKIEKGQEKPLVCGQH